MDEKIIFESKNINDFINEYTAKETIRQHKIALKKYFTHYDKDPDKYIIDIRDLNNHDRNNTTDQYEKDITQYRNYLTREEYSPKAIHNYVSSVKMFLEHHRIDLDKAFWKKLRSRGIEKTNDSVCNFKVPKPDDLKKILTHANTKSRSMSLLQFSSGMRIGEICNLKLSDIDLDYEYPHITLRKTKTRAKGRTRCSPEAKEAILEWLKIRQDALDTQKKLTLPEYWDKDNEERLFPGTPKNARKMWNRLLEKSRYAKKDKSGKYPRNLMGTHSLRKAFRSEFSKHDNDLAAYLMNQRTGLDRKYRDWSDEYLDQEYAKGMQYLMVFQSNVTDERLNDVQEKLTDLKDENKKLHNDVDKLRMELLEVKMKQVQELQRKNK